MSEENKQESICDKVTGILGKEGYQQQAHSTLGNPLQYQRPCPQCGYCPCCGRSNNQYPNNQYPIYPYPNYPLPIITCGTHQHPSGG